MIKTIKIILAFVFLLVAFSATALILLHQNAEVTFLYRTEKPLFVEFHPSKPMKKEIAEDLLISIALEKTGTKFQSAKINIPAINLRQVRMGLPAHSKLELKEIKYSLACFWICTPAIEELYHRGRQNKNMSVSLVDDTHNSICFKTDDSSGTWEVRLANDFPRILPFLLAGAILFILVLLILILFSPNVRKKIQRIKNHKDLILICFFLSILILPTIVQDFFMGKEHKRQPELIFSQMQEYPASFSDWYRYHLPFRRFFFELHYKISSLLNIPPVKDVIPGIDGWWFYNAQVKEKGEMPYADYMGTNLYTTKQLEKILSNLVRIRNDLRKNNIRFIVYIAPNKHAVYGSQMLPPSYRRKDDAILTRARQVVRYIQKNSDIQILYPEQELNEARTKLGYPIYYKGDAHWNPVGSYVGTISLLNGIDSKLAAKFPSWETLKITAPGVRLRGELRELMQAPSDITEPIFFPEIKSPSPYWKIPSSYGYFELPPSTVKGPRVFAIRDSFFSGIATYLYPSCEQLALYWYYDYNPTMIMEFKPDIVVLETVERFLDRFLEMPEVHERRGEIYVR